MSTAVIFTVNVPTVTPKLLEGMFKKAQKMYAEGKKIDCVKGPYKDDAGEELYLLIWNPITPDHKCPVESK